MANPADAWQTGRAAAQGPFAISLPPLPAGFTLLQVTPRLDGGGVEQVTLETAAAVVAAGGRALVASAGGRMEAALAVAGGELVRLPLDSRDPLTIALNAGRLATAIRREGVSLVHVRSRAPAFSALPAARRAGVPVIATYHGIYSGRSGVKRWYNGVMTRGDLVIANSRFTRDHVRATHGVADDRIVVIGEGVDDRVFDPAAVSAARVAAVRADWGVAPGEAARVVLLAARLTAWKGQRMLIEALARAAPAADVVLILAGRASGSDAYRDALVAVASAAGLADRIRLVGPCADMPAAFAAADLVVAPSTRAESFGRGVVEAAMMQTPVIASAIGAHLETVADGETGWLAPPGDVAAWAAGLTRALTTRPETLAAMGAAARARATRLFGAGAMMRETLALYARLAKAARR